MDDHFAKENLKQEKLAVQHSSPPRKKGGLGAAARPRDALTKDERSEKYYDLLQENLKLKQHQKSLDDEIKKMSTRLTRITTMVSKERRLAGGTVSKEVCENTHLTSQVDMQIEELADENTKLKDQVRKLSTVVKSMQH